MRNRRRLLFAAGGAAALGGCSYSLEHGLLNACRAELPARLARSEALAAAWDGIDAARVWDCHVHLIGSGDSGGGIWINPATFNIANPAKYARRALYLNAGCIDEGPGGVDQSYVQRMLNLLDAMPPGVKLVLLSFDRHYAGDGAALPRETAFYVPDSYAEATARRHPDRFEWAASIHPYRGDWRAALRAAKATGARAVKWLPAAMGIDPAAARCDAFYAELVKLDLPLLTHGGMERAVAVGDRQHLGNPLLLRPALEHGVRVVVAHCATLGEDRDLDRGEHGPFVPSFSLFARLMDDPRYRATLYGDISSIAQMNRAGPFLVALIEREDWHPRLLNGSDYPLPGIVPLYSLSRLVQLRVLDEDLAPLLAEVREHNPLLFDFALKRHLRAGGRRFAASVFETRRFFDGMLPS
jgi:mannonate dehydratase